MTLSLFWRWDFIMFGHLSSSCLHGCKGTYGARIESHNEQ